MGTSTTLTDGIHQYLPYEGGEFTFEANPNDLQDTEKLQVLKDNGVNRLSIGVQSFNDQILKQIGRIHRSTDVYRAIDNARKVGFENMSIDLIFRLPQQSEADFMDSLNKAIELDLPHYSTYSLILERKTIFYNLMRQGKLHLPSQDVEAHMYQAAIDSFKRAGLDQYEISNFAKPGFQSAHNLTYWRNEKYFGFGAGAYGYLGKDRYHNFGPIQQYLEPLKENKVPVIERHVLPLTEQMEEELFLGLRTMQGVSISHFQDKFNYPLQNVYGETVATQIAKGYLKQEGDWLRLTESGKFLGNEVFQEFLLDSY